MSTILTTPTPGMGLNLLNTLTTAAGRIPALLFSAAGVIGTGELAVRLVSVILTSTTGWKTATWGKEAENIRLQAEERAAKRAKGEEATEPQQTALEKVTAWIYAKTHVNVRPYKEKRTWDLVKATVAAIALGILLNEAVRIFAGPAPQLYNKILTVLGPIRIDTSPYLANVQAVFNELKTWLDRPVIVPVVPAVVA